jgi:hypothetical protein
MTAYPANTDLPEVALNYADGHRPHPMPIHDGRAIIERLSLDRQGFELRHHETTVSNFYDAAEVRAIYYPEVERLLTAATGAARAVAFEHDVRCAPRRGVGDVRGPVHVVHDDYTEVSAPERVRLYLPAEADALLRRRYSVINVWRSIKGTVRDTPLAVCDAQSMRPEDRIPTTGGVKHEVYMFHFSLNHRWYYFPAMTPDEALLLKCFDSIHDGRARFTAHTAFQDPTAPPDATARESIEVRALVFFNA